MKAVDVVDLPLLYRGLYERASAALVRLEGSLRLPIREDKLNKALIALERIQIDIKETEDQLLVRKFGSTISNAQELLLEVRKRAREPGQSLHSKTSGILVSVLLGDLPSLRQLVSDWADAQEAEV